MHFAGVLRRIFIVIREVPQAVDPATAEDLEKATVVKVAKLAMEQGSTAGLVLSGWVA